MALQNKDQQKVAELVKSALTLAPPERITSLSQMGEKQLAWQLGREHLESSASTEERILKADLVNMHPKMVHASRLKQKTYSSWNIKETELMKEIKSITYG